MAVTLISGVGGLNLNDLARFTLVDFDLGENIREEAFIESWWSPTPVLSNKVDRKTKMAITLKVKGVNDLADTNPTMNKLVTNVQSVRNEFSNQMNFLNWSIGGTIKQINTLPSVIAPALIGDQRDDIITRDFMIPRWTFELWRLPYFQGNVREMII